MSQQRAVMYDRTGSPEELHLADVAVPTPGEGRALLDVRAVGINPYDVKVLTGAAPRESAFPRGIGSDVAGVVTQTGADAAYADGTPIAEGDTVFGWGLNTLRERLIVRGTSVTPVPDGMSVETAAGLVTPALAAGACLRAVPITSADTVFVSGASGSVGFLVAQLAVRAGARVLGTASPAHAERLRAADIEPITYGDGLLERLQRALGGETITAAIDTAGASALGVLRDVGVPGDRTATLAGDDVASEFGVIAPDTSQRSTATLAEIGALVASGVISFPIARTFTMADAPEAFAVVASRRAGGKVVITPASLRS